MEDKQWSAPLTRGFLKAGEEMGYNVVDPNGPEQIGERGQEELGSERRGGCE